jgi:hypothetical protein
MFKVQNPPTGKVQQQGRMHMLPAHHVTTRSPAVKILGPIGNGDGGGNGLDLVHGRGLAHRKWTVAERIAHAADVATGVKQLDLSQGQLCSVFHITTAALRAELKARANGNGHEDAALAAARQRLLEVVAELGISPTIDLLCDIEMQTRIEDLDRQAQVEDLDVE